MLDERADDAAVDQERMSEPVAMTVLVCDSRAVSRAGLVSTLCESGNNVAACGLDDLVAYVERLRPDLLVLGTRSGHTTSFAAAAAAQEVHESLRVLAVMDGVTMGDLREAVARGLHGFLLEGSDARELVDAVAKTLRGENVVPTTVAMMLAGTLLEQSAVHPCGVTADEVRVLELVADGQSNLDIGAVLNLGRVEVKALVSSVFTKLGVAERTEAVAKAFRLGLLS